MADMALGSCSIEELLLRDVERSGLLPSQASEFYQGLQQVLDSCTTLDEAWRKISEGLLRPHHPHSLHQLMYYSTYCNWDVSKRGPPPAWFPKLEHAKQTGLGKLLEARGREFLGDSYVDPITSFAPFQKFTTIYPEIFWEAAFSNLSLHFQVPPSCILGPETMSHPGGRWLPGAVLNIAESCLSIKADINKTDDSTAIIWRDEGHDELPLCTMTLAELRKHVNQVANALKAAGFQIGDAIAIDMPMHVKAVIIYLAIILAGHVVVSIADSFVSSEIATRLRISKAKAIFTQDVILRGGKTIPLYRRVVDANPPAVIVLPSDGISMCVALRTQDCSWKTFLNRTNELDRPHEFSAVHLPVEAWTNVLFSSGTTAEPKAIPWNQTTGIRAAAESWAHFDLKSGETFCWPTNLGWMVGPFFISASLLTGTTMALYNGAPLGRGFGKFVQDARVTRLGTVPSMVKTWKKTGCMDSLDWSHISVITTTGEASSLDDDLWLSSRVSYKPVLECCGGTELASAFLHGSLLQRQSFATFSTPGLTVRFVLLDDYGTPYPDDKPCIGEIALFPKMLGASSALLNADHDEVYFKGMPVFKGMQLRRHGDVIERMVGGYYRAQGRADDAMNLGGIKVSAVEVERVCNGADSSVLETAAIALPPAGGGPDKLIIATVLKDEKLPRTETLTRTFQEAIRTKLNPLFKVHSVVVLSEFPRTASNKIMRRILRAQLQPLAKL